MNNIKDRAKNIKLIILDVDGVLTDGSLFYDDSGREFKAFHSKDGLGLRMAQDAGIEVALLTGRKSALVKHRAKNLKIRPELVFQGYRDKRPAYLDIKKATGFSDAEIAYVGDDVVDLPVMVQVGLAIAVHDAHAFVLEHADWVTELKGGRGAVREVCDFILEAQGKLQHIHQDLIQWWARNDQNS